MVIDKNTEERTQQVQTLIWENMWALWLKIEAGTWQKPSLPRAPPASKEKQCGAVGVGIWHSS